MAVIRYTITNLARSGACFAGAALGVKLVGYDFPVSGVLHDGSPVMKWWFAVVRLDGDVALFGFPELAHLGDCLLHAVQFEGLFLEVAGLAAQGRRDGAE